VTPSTAEAVVRRLASDLGIAIDGSRPSDLRVHDPRFYRRVLAEGSLGLGESYMEGWWDCDDLVELHCLIARGDAEGRIRPSWRTLWHAARARLVDLQSRRRAALVAKTHYDVTVDHYAAMTDPWNTMSCGYWRDATTLAEAQEAKLDLVCRKLRLSAQDRVLDIGCGLGSFARYAATKYGCAVVGLSIAGEQVRTVRERCADLPVTVHHCDYRDVEVFAKDGPFDKVVSLEMFEHVGVKNHRTYFEVTHRCLRPGGLFLLQTVGANVSSHRNDPWFDKYIFPNGVVPSVAQIGTAIENLFVLEDWHSFGPDYVKTLSAWFENFDRQWRGPRDDAFYRMWKYYLLSAAGGFKARRRQIWQLLLSKGGVPDAGPRES
jgi:cyclopropane-fatty-acyl-phospholipid synthase